jgi:WD40 repeat protein/serine/threonine protein kinase
VTIPLKSSILRADNDPALAHAVEFLTQLIETGDDAAVEAALVSEYSTLQNELRRLLPAIRLLASIGSIPRGDADAIAVNSREPARPRISGTLGDFRLIREIGRGGMGVVYEAEQISLSRRVAVKVLPLAAMLDERQLQRFKNEAVSAASLKHPNIVTVFFVGCERGMHYYAMQLIEGRTLADFIVARSAVSCGDDYVPDMRSGSDFLIGEDSFRAAACSPLPGLEERRNQLPPRISSLDTKELHTSTRKTPLHSAAFYRQVAQFGIQAAEAIEHAHQCGVIHRDIKPSNLLIDAAGRLWVTDFGLARMESSLSLTTTGDLVGTLRYMSPEQATGVAADVDHRTDIYSLGATLYELLALRPVFTGERRQELLRQIAEQSPKSLAHFGGDIPRDLETIVFKALAKDACDRYSSAALMAADLRRFCEGQPIGARRPTLWRRSVSWSRRNTALLLGASSGMAVAVLIAMVLAGLLWHSREETKRALAASNANLEMAQNRENVAREHWYVSDIADARQQILQGDLDSARALLERHQVTRPDVLDYRGFEWHYLWQEVQKRPVEFVGHQGDVYTADFSPDGARLATAGRDGVIRIWDRATGTLLHEFLGSLSDVNCVRFHPHGDELISASGDGTVRFWDYRHEKETGRLPFRSGEIVSAIYSPNAAEVIATGGQDGKIRIWDGPTHELKHIIDAHSDRIQDIAFSGDGKVMASVSAKERVQIWDPLKGARLHDIPRQIQGNTHCVALSADGNSMVQGHFLGNRGTISRWNTAGNIVSLADYQLTNDHGPESVNWMPHQQAVASAGGNGEVRLWDLSGRSAELRPYMIVRAHPSGGVWCCRFSSDGRWLVVTNRSGRVTVHPVPRDATQMIDLNLAGSSITAVEISPDGRDVITATRDGILRKSRWSSGETPEVMSSLRLAKSEFVGGLAISPDQRTLAVSLSSQGVHLLDPARSQLTPSPVEGYHPTFSRDGDLLATTTPTHVVLTRLSTGEIVQRLPADYVRNLHFASNGTALIGIQPNGQLFLWDLQTFTRLDQELFTREKWKSVASSPDGRFLAGGTMDGSIVVWSLSPFREHVRMKQRGQDSGTSSPIMALAFSPDGKTLAACDQERGVHLWRIANGRELLTFCPLGQSDNRALSITPDGQHLLALGTKYGNPSLAVWSLGGSR